DVSLDGGSSWQAASAGPATWSFTFTPTAPGVLTIVSRAATAHAVEVPDRTVTVTVRAADGSCPCVLQFPPAGVGPADDPDSVPVELGLRFRSDRPGSVLGLLFVHYPDNVGPFVGHLWTDTGDLLAEATLDSTADARPYLRFDQPVPIEADRTYV